MNIYMDINSTKFILIKQKYKYNTNSKDKYWLYKKYIKIIKLNNIIIIIFWKIIKIIWKYENK